MFASTTLMVPEFLRGTFSNVLGSRRTNKKLVVVQLSGGNDGLNTIIPFENDIYYRSRPTLNISKYETLKVSDELGFNPALKPLQALFEQGRMSIINSVGYPNPDRSHFRSMDIWQTASSSHEHWSTGWLGRYLDSNCAGCEKAHAAVEVDDGLSLAMKGKLRSGFAASNSKRLKKASANPFLNQVAKHPNQQNDNISYLYKTLINTQSSADYLYEKSRLHRSKVTYPSSRFAQDLKQIAELMTADSETQIYYVSLGGFDTHVGQKNKQNRLLQQYAEGMKAFMDDLEKNKMQNEVLVMTFSEFGRRVKQNGSKGTDHGTANNVFLMSGNLRQPGFYNAAPNLAQLDKGDLKYTVDFRNIYATILDRWLLADAKAILQGQFKLMRMI